MLFTTIIGGSIGMAVDGIVGLHLFALVCLCCWGMRKQGRREPLKQF
jgi:hypothetical protein